MWRRNANLQVYTPSGSHSSTIQLSSRICLRLLRQSVRLVGENDNQFVLKLSWIDDETLRESWTGRKSWNDESLHQLNFLFSDFLKSYDKLTSPFGACRKLARNRSVHVLLPQIGSWRVITHHPSAECLVFISWRQEQWIFFNRYEKAIEKNLQEPITWKFNATQWLGQRQLQLQCSAAFPEVL